MFNEFEKKTVQQLLSERIQQLEHEINEYGESDELLDEKLALESVSRKIHNS